MARVRSSARLSRQGAGGMYEAGYQFRKLPSAKVILGPWTGVIEDHNEVSNDKLVLLTDGYIKDGKIRAVRDYLIGGTEYQNSIQRISFGTLAGEKIWLSWDGSGNVTLNVWHSNAATGSSPSTSTYSVALGSGLGVENRYSIVVYQDLVYIGERVGGLVKFEIPSTETSVSGVNGVHDMVLVGNNLIVLDTASSPAIVQHSVDSDLDDFTGVGAGSQIIPGEVGAGVRLLTWGDGALLVGSKGAWVIEPTGTLPAFQYRMLPNFHGAYYIGSRKTYGALTVDDELYYLNNAGELCVYREGISTRIPFTPIVSLPPAYVYIHYVESLDFVALSLRGVSGTGETHFFNRETKQWVGSLRCAFSALGSRGVTEELFGAGWDPVFGGGSLHKALILSTSTSAITTRFNAKTGYVRFDRAVHISTVELHTNAVISTSTTDPRDVVFNVVYNDGTTEALSSPHSPSSTQIQYQVFDRWIEYYINRDVKEIQIVLNNAALEVSTDTEYTQIVINLMGVEDEDILPQL